MLAEKQAYIDFSFQFLHLYLWNALHKSMENAETGMSCAFHQNKESPYFGMTQQ